MTVAGRRVLVSVVSALVAGVILFLLLDLETLARVGAALVAANPLAMALALALMPLVQWLRARRFQGLAFEPGQAAPPGLFAVTSALLLANTIIPFRMGEISFPLMMRRLHGIGLVDASGALILARGLDFIIVGALLAGALGLAALAAGGDGVEVSVGVFTVIPPLAYLALGLLGLLAALVAVLAGPVIHERVAALAPDSGVVARVHAVVSRLGLALARLKRGRRALRVFALSLAVWLLHAAAAALASHATEPSVPLALALAAGLAANLAFALPASNIAGLGAPQAAWVGVMMAGGVTLEAGIVTAFAYYAVTLSATVVIGVGATAVLLPRLRAGRLRTGQGMPPRI